MITDKYALELTRSELLTVRSALVKNYNLTLRAARRKDTKTRPRPSVMAIELAGTRRIIGLCDQALGQNDGDGSS